MKAIKLSETHYIVVDDSKRGYRGYNYNFALSRIDNLSSGYKEHTSEWNWCYKITHSTPIGGLSAMLVAGVKELSLSEVEEAIYGYSVEKMIKQYTGEEMNREDKKLYAILHSILKQYKELVKDKLFTIEDIRKAIQMAWEADSIDGIVDLNVVLHYGNNNDLRTKWSEEEIIQSLLPKTEWEVEFDEQGKLKLI